MEMTKQKMLNMLLDRANGIYYSKTKNEEHFYFYVEGFNCQFKIESPQVNGIRFSLNYKNDHNEEKNIAYFMNDVETIKSTSTFLTNSLWHQRNQSFFEDGELPFIEKYMELFKKILKEEKLPSNITIDKIESGYKEKIEIKEGNHTHTIHIGQCLDSINNQIKTCLGCVEVKVVIETDVPNQNNHKHRVIAMLISGYELYQYPILEKKFSNPILANNIKEWINNLQQVDNESLKTQFLNLVLEVELEEKPIDKIGSKIKI